MEEERMTGTTKIIEVNKAYHSAVDRIDKKGGYKKLAEAFPKRLKEVEDALEKNWTLEGIKEWETAIMRGLDKVGGK